jgi:hypothetical protein
MKEWRNVQISVNSLTLQPRFDHNAWKIPSKSLNFGQKVIENQQDFEDIQTCYCDGFFSRITGLKAGNSDK